LNKREVILLLIIIAMFVLVMLFMAKTNSIGQRLSELEFEQQRACNMSVLVTCVPTIPLEAKEVNFINRTVKQDQLQVNNQLRFSPDSKNIAILEACVYQWLQDAITVKDTFACIEGYMKKEQLQVQGPEP
jgi:hypothetical protein